MNTNEIIKYKCKIKKAHFVLDEYSQPIDLKNITESNFKNYFRITDLEQGNLGKYFLK